VLTQIRERLLSKLLQLWLVAALRVLIEQLDGVLVATELHLHITAVRNLDHSPSQLLEHLRVLRVRARRQVQPCAAAFSFSLACVWSLIIMSANSRTRLFWDYLLRELTGLNFEKVAVGCLVHEFLSRRACAEATAGGVDGAVV
jgi:hypothetical protein